MKLIAGQEKGLTVFLHLNWHTCNRANPFQGFSAVSPYNRRIRDPYVRWCERRTPSVSGGAVYSITCWLYFFVRLSALAKTYSFAIFGFSVGLFELQICMALSGCIFSQFVLFFLLSFHIQNH